MDSELQRSQNEYYKAVASEYDDIYDGGGPANIPDPDAYKNEVHIISALLPGYTGEKHVDIACGTGFWLPFYESNCSEITLIDQAEEMISECSLRIGELGIADKTELICDDVFGYPFEQNKYDSALVSLLISHLPEAQEKRFFDILKSILKPSGRFIIMESIWSKERAATQKKTAVVKRKLKDGREFKIYKRYFEKKDFDDLARKYGISMTVIHEGRVFILIVGSV